MRAEKRVVNAKKELVKLKEIAAKLHGPKRQDTIENELPDVQVREAGECAMMVDEDVSRISKNEAKRINNQWMNQRKIKQVKQKIKRHQKKKSRRAGSAGLSSRKVRKGLRK